VRFSPVKALVTLNSSLIIGNPEVIRNGLREIAPIVSAHA